MAGRLIAAIDALNRRVGFAAAWLALALVVVQFAVVLLRYVFAIGFVWMQESVLYFYGIGFMAGAGYTLLRDEHVRVDVFYREAAPRRRALVDLLGAVFCVLPFCALVVWFSFDYVLRSWSVAEGSSEAQGLPLTFAFKTVILVFAVLLGLQGIAMVLRCRASLTGGGADKAADRDHNVR